VAPLDPERERESERERERERESERERPQPMAWGVPVIGTHTEKSEIPRLRRALRYLPKNFLSPLDFFLVSGETAAVVAVGASLADFR